MGQETGLLLFRRTRAVAGPLCRDCGTSLFRQYTSRTLVTGWWGIISLFANIITITRNLAFRRRLGRLSPPAPRASGPGLLARPLDPGSPLIVRPGTLGGLAIIGIVIAGIVAGVASQSDRDDSGAIVGAGRLSVTDLRVGDCFQEPSGDEFNSVRAVPCDDLHDYELFHTFVMSASPDVDYPDGGEFDDAAAAECFPAFDQYVGQRYEESELDISVFVPTAAAWDMSDRDVACAVLEPNGSRLATTVRASGR